MHLLIVNLEFWICTSTEAQNQPHFPENDVPLTADPCGSFGLSFVQFGWKTHYFIIPPWSVLCVRGVFFVLSIYFRSVRNKLYVISVRSQKFSHIIKYCLFPYSIHTSYYYYYYTTSTSIFSQECVYINVTRNIVIDICDCYTTSNPIFTYNTCNDRLLHNPPSLLQ